MNGDLSLSGTLGGLRIANPDDEAVLSPIQSNDAGAENAEDNDAASTSQRSTSTIRDLRSEPLRSEPDSLIASAHVSRKGPSSKSYPPPQIQQYAASQQPQPQPQHQHRPSIGPTEYESLRRMAPVHESRPRPASAFYDHPNTSSSSNVSSREQSRYASDMMAQQQLGISRSASRSASHPVDRGYPARQPSQRDRYRSSQQYSSQPHPASNGTVPARRPSKRVPPNSTQNDRSSPYTTEGGPLQSSEEWQERGSTVVSRSVVDRDGNTVSRLVKKGVRDFNFGRTLGEGSYSTVLAATDRQTGREYAIKVLDKGHILKEKKVKYVNIEKDTLNRLTGHPGIVRLYYTFQDERSLYFVLDLASGGELLGVLKKTGTFNEECTRFYAAQILDSIAYMHSRGVIHRDLKPENVLLDSSMHTKITDFGTAKILSLSSSPRANETAGNPLDGADSDRAQSFVGTAEYVSPELLTDKNACKASDLWAFGCIVFQLLAGRPPFKASNEYQTFQKIVALDYHFPDGFPPIAKDLVQRLLVLEPSQRLPVEHIKSHAFFDGVQWGRGLWQMAAPKLKPYVPPSPEPIKLNGAGAPVASASRQGASTPALGSHPRPQLRAVTELPPPSQLDIDWSPVLTRPNERILKMGNLIVTSQPLPTSPQPGSAPSSTQADAPRGFSRFFGGGTTKKKQRLVMITSTARIIVVAAGGDEKKAKMELPLMKTGVTCKVYKDARGLTAFCVESKDKQHTFEDPTASTSDPEGSKYSTKEWMEKIEWAKELAVSQSVANSFSAGSQYTDLGSSAMPSPASTADSEGNFEQGTTRNVLRRDADSESVRSSRKHRFSKRHSKYGLAAVF